MISNRSTRSCNGHRQTGMNLKHPTRRDITLPSGPTVLSFLISIFRGKNVLARNVVQTALFFFNRFPLHFSVTPPKNVLRLAIIPAVSTWSETCLPNQIAAWGIGISIFLLLAAIAVAMIRPITQTHRAMPATPLRPVDGYLQRIASITGPAVTFWACIEEK